MDLTSTSKEILFYGNQTNPLSLVAEFYPSSDLVKVNRTFRKNVNVIKMTELLKLQEYFTNPTLKIKNPKVIEVVEKIQELLSEVFDISTKAHIKSEDHTRIREIATEIFTVLKKELKKLRIFSRTMSHIREEIVKDSFSHEKFVRMFEEINQKYLDLRKKNLLIGLAIIFIVVFSIIAAACLIATLVFLIKAAIPSIKISDQKDVIFHDILNEKFIEYFKNTNIEEILSHARNLEEKKMLKYFIEHLDDFKIIYISRRTTVGWRVICGKYDIWLYKLPPFHDNIWRATLLLYNNNSTVQDLTKLQNKIWGPFALKELLPLSLSLLITLTIIITSIIILCFVIDSKYNLKRQNPNVTRYINY